MSYGANLAELFRSAASFVDKIFKGAKPSELPVEQPTRFELVINLKTAKDLGLTITRDFLLIADEDRVGRVTSAPGTFRTSDDVRSESALGEKRKSDLRAARSAFDPCDIPPNH
jgi:hypothetical protein